MAKKTIRVILCTLLLMGLVVSGVNFFSSGLKAGSITKYGTYDKPGDEEKCPGTASNCCIVWYVPDG
jgi:hypothetical protein